MHILCKKKTREPIPEAIFRNTVNNIIIIKRGRDYIYKDCEFNVRDKIITMNKTMMA
jgi:hypothetical protein